MTTEGSPRPGSSPAGASGDAEVDEESDATESANASVESDAAGSENASVETDAAEKVETATVRDGRVIDEETTARAEASDDDERIVRETERWRGITALAFATAGAGLVLSHPPLLLASVVAIGFAAYARSGAPPRVELAIAREVEDATPDIGEEVAVETTVKNEGSTVFDLRVFDGVPEGLAVVEGTARCYTALRPGGEATFTYRVEASRGAHEWADPRVIARDASGAVEVDTRVPGPATEVTCVPRLEPVEEFPLRTLTTHYTGAVASRDAGPGVEFHSLREYRPGDPLGRVAWSELAKTGRLATRQFHAEQMATVVLAVDAREAAYLGVDTAPTAFEHSVRGARRLAGAALSEGNRVGVAGLGPENCWLNPGLGRAHRARLEEFLATEPVLSPAPPEETFYPPQLDELRARIRGESQVVWLSPLPDAYAVEVARTLEAAGHAVTVVTPDPTGEDTTGRRLARAERRFRLVSLREAGVRVVDWRPPEPLEAAVARAVRGWRR